jgi:hypothetical protein
LLFGQVCHGRGHRVEEGHAPVFRLPSFSLRRYSAGKLGKPLANCLGNLMFGRSSVLTKKHLQLSRSYKRNGDGRLRTISAVLLAWISAFVVVDSIPSGRFFPDLTIDSVLAAQLDRIIEFILVQINSAVLSVAGKKKAESLR